MHPGKKRDIISFSALTDCNAHPEISERTEFVLIRYATPDDREFYIEQMEQFYASPYVLHPIPHDAVVRNFDEAMRPDAFLEIFILEYEGKRVGFANVTKSYSTEVGGKVIQLEDIYMMPGYRNKGLGREYLKYLEQRFGGLVKRFRLEVEPSNTVAISLYEKLGYTELNYRQMIKDL